MRSKFVLGLLCAASISVALAGAAYAQQTVKIGAIFPLSGNAASAGVHAKAAIETAVEIINNGHPGLGSLPTTKGPGLAGLGGAKVEVVFADNQGSPAVGKEYDPATHIAVPGNTARQRLIQSGRAQQQQ